MYRLYVFIANVNSRWLSEFVKLASSMFGTDVLAEKAALKVPQKRVGQYGAFFFELAIDEAKRKAVHRWFSEQGIKHSDPIAMVVVGLEDNLLQSTVNTGDVSPGTPYTWEKFVENATKRFKVG